MSENTNFQQMTLVTSVIPRFCVICIEELISDIILMIQDHFQGPFEGQNYEKMIFSKYK